MLISRFGASRRPGPMSHEPRPWMTGRQTARPCRIGCSLAGKSSDGSSFSEGRKGEGILHGSHAGHALSDSRCLFELRLFGYPAFQQDCSVARAHGNARRTQTLCARKRCQHALAQRAVSRLVRYRGRARHRSGCACGTARLRAHVTRHRDGHGASGNMSGSNDFHFAVLLSIEWLSGAIRAQKRCVIPATASVWLVPGLDTATPGQLIVAAPLLRM